MRFRTLLGLGVAVACAASVAVLLGATRIANADPVAAPICAADEGAGATALSGTYTNLTIVGNAYVADNATVKVNGDLTLAPGACLDAFSLGTVQVSGNVNVGIFGTLALGCAPGANGPPGTPPCTSVPPDTVGGSILAYWPKTMYLTAVTVGGDVSSYGGGFGLPYVNFPVKNMNIAGSLTIADWYAGPNSWVGALRNHVGGNVELYGNWGNNPDVDSMEVDGNTIGHNLDCQSNFPYAQYGDAYDPAEGNGPNTVGGSATGQCATLTTAPSS